eukprot:gene22799-29968_t
MKSIFGAKKEKAPVPTLDEASERMGGRADRIDEKLKLLDQQLAKYKEQISAKAEAQVLKQKRMYEGQRDQMYNQQFNMDQTKFTVDSIKDTVSTVQAMSAANKEMKTVMKKNKELDINYIDKIHVFSRVPSYDASEADMGTGSCGYDVGGVSMMLPSLLLEPDYSDMPSAPTQERPHAQNEGLPAMRI